MKTLITSFLVLFSSIYASHGKVISHKSLPEFTMNGNTFVGLATHKLGASDFEIWRTSIESGSCTPKHTPDCEETFIFLKGKGKIIIGGEEKILEAPCTVITPANVEHQYFNIGGEQIDAIVILEVGSQIIDEAGLEMKLPWRD